MTLQVAFFARRHLTKFARRHLMEFLAMFTLWATCRQMWPKSDLWLIFSWQCEQHKPQTIILVVESDLYNSDLSHFGYVHTAGKFWFTFGSDLFLSWQREQHKPHGIWSFHFWFVPLSYVVLNPIQVRCSAMRLQCHGGLQCHAGHVGFHATFTSL